MFNYRSLIPKRLIKIQKEFARLRKISRHFTRHLKRHYKKFVIANLCAVAYAMLGVLSPWPLKLIFDNILFGYPLPDLVAAPLGHYAEQPMAVLYVCVGAMMVLACARGVAYYYQRLLTARIGEQVATGMRQELFRHLQNLSSSFHSRRNTGDLITRLTSDIRMLRMALVRLPIKITRHVFYMTAMLVIMAFMNLKLTLAALLVVPILILLLKKYRKPMRQTIRKQREKEGQLATHAAETLGAMSVVQGFGGEEQELERFKSRNKASLRGGLKTARIEAKLRWASDMAVSGVTALVIYLAVQEVLGNRLRPGDIIVFASYLRHFNQPLRSMSSILEQLVRGSAAGDRVIRILQIRPDVADRKSAQPAPSLNGAIEFKNVSFGYKGTRKVLKDIQLRIEPNTRVGVIGTTGSGKSTLMQLLPRFYDPTDGGILINGKDIRSYSLGSLRSNLSIVFQDAILFNATIAENITYGHPGASESDVRAAAKEAGISHIIEALPEGYETQLGERGDTLSGGEKQCVAIARAVIKNSPIVILDEPTTGLDQHSAQLVMDSVQRIMQNRTVLLITHHLELLNSVDRVIVVSNGQIIDDGPPSRVLPEVQDRPEFGIVRQDPPAPINGGESSPISL